MIAYKILYKRLYLPIYNKRSCRSFPWIVFNMNAGDYLFIIFVNIYYEYPPFVMIRKKMLRISRDHQLLIGTHN